MTMCFCCKLEPLNRTNTRTLQCNFTKCSIEYKTQNKTTLDKIVLYSLTLEDKNMFISLVKKESNIELAPFCKYTVNDMAKRFCLFMRVVWQSLSASTAKVFCSVFLYGCVSGPCQTISPFCDRQSCLEGTKKLAERPDCTSDSI